MNTAKIYVANENLQLTLKKKEEEKNDIFNLAI